MLADRRQVWRIARTEFVRTTRAVRNSTMQAVAIAVAILGFTFMSAVMGYFFSIAGRQLRAGEFGSTPITGGLIGGVRGVLGVLVVGLVAMATIRTVASRGGVDEPETLLLAARVRDVVPGLLLAELANYVTWLVLPILVAVGGFAYGARAPLVVLAVPVVVVGVLVPALWLGFCLGVLGRHLATRFEPIARNRSVILLLAGLGYVAFVFGDGFAILSGVLFEPMQSSPLSWYADLLLLGVPNVDASPLRAGAALATSVAMVAVLSPVSVRLVNFHWFSDPALETEHEPSSASASAEGGRLDALLGSAGGWAGVFDRPTRSVVRVAWTRTRRAPIKLLYAVYPVFLLLSDVRTVVETGSIPAHLPWVLGLYVAWGAALAFALNPLGDDGPALPVTLTAPVTGRQYVVGHVLAGALVGVPLSLLVVGPVAALSPLPVELAVLAVAVAVVASVVAPLLAVGVGMLFPRFGSVKVAGNRTAVVPSKSALAAFSSGLAVIAGSAVLAFVPAARELLAGLFNVVFAFATPWELGVAAATLRPVALAVLALGVCSPVASYRYAVRRFERFTLE
ncbi:hypothetical protein [Haloarchaeobius sp. HRN-SO-5]|uniref:hypothetical protein n=1 Tax=Haloarchaeobius sp. HRN-SO-5 TaxID=3446118 RepID=UPI003EB8AA3F